VAQRPLIAVTMGDPGGIGPEVAVRACARLPRLARFVLIGDRGVLEGAARRFAADGKTPMVEASSLSAAERRAGKARPAGAEAA